MNLLNEKNLDLSNEFKYWESIFPGTTETEWNDWKWHLSHLINDATMFKNFNIENQNSKGQFFNLGVSPYFYSRIQFLKSHPLAKTILPTTNEFITYPEESIDPLGEIAFQKIPNLVHRYQDRALLLVTSFCGTYCRYCTRSRLVGKSSVEVNTVNKNLDLAFQYLNEHSEIKDVLISGGDPLILSDDKLDSILEKLYSISHIKTVRIGTKIPIVIPQRITKSLVNILKKYDSLWLSLHIIHPDELSELVLDKLSLIQKNGIPILTQTVLLKGINDDAKILENLFRILISNKIRPYYLLHCDPIKGSSHFRTSVEKGIELLTYLKSKLPGYGVPQFIVDLPGDGRKLSLNSENNFEITDKNVCFTIQNKKYNYPNGID